MVAIKVLCGLCKGLLQFTRRKRCEKNTNKRLTARATCHDVINSEQNFFTETKVHFTRALANNLAARSRENFSKAEDPKVPTRLLGVDVLRMSDDLLFWAFFSYCLFRLSVTHPPLVTPCNSS